MKKYIRGLAKELFRLLLVATLLFPTMGTGMARADPVWTQTSQADFEAGTLFQVDTTSSPGDVKLATDGIGNNHVYALRGRDSEDFWRYDISANSWASRAEVSAWLQPQLFSPNCPCITT